MSRRTLWFAALMAATIGLAAAAAPASDLKGLVKELLTVPSITGSEDELGARIRKSLGAVPGVEIDGLNTLSVDLGGHPATTLVLAALDGYGHMVSGITPEGYLTLDRPVAPPHGRFDAFLLGQPVVVSTSRGPINGVVAQPAMHLLTPERRQALVEGFSLETAFVDIGVRSEKEARAKGVQILDPVTYPAVLTELQGGLWAGPDLGLRSAAAVLASAVLSLDGAKGDAVVVWAAQTKLAARGRGERPSLGALRARTRWAPRRVVIVDVVAEGKDGSPPLCGRGPALIPSREGPSTLKEDIEKTAAASSSPLQTLAPAATPLTRPFTGPDEEVVTLALPVRFLHTPSEIVNLKDLEVLAALLGRFLKEGGSR